MEKTILVAHDAPNKYTINFYNSVTGKTERYVFPEYKRGSKRERVNRISEECYYYLKDETSAFKNGSLRIVTEKLPKEVLEVQKDAEQEVIDTTPEYVDNVLTKEQIEKIMKGAKSGLAKKLGGITTDTQKQFVIETIKEIGITDLGKLREVVKLFYGEDMELDYIFPEEN